MNPTFKRLMPNFSHGTAGIAYFLATLYSETGREEFLAAAERGARYLQAQAETGGEICLVFHNEPDGKDLYYLGWCHGPAGTAQLLARASRENTGMKWVQPEHRVRPELLVAQTGYMQGAAVIGMWLLHLDSFLKGKEKRITFPDSPF